MSYSSRRKGLGFGPVLTMPAPTMTTPSGAPAMTTTTVRKTATISGGVPVPSGAFDALVPADCAAPVTYQGPPDPVPDGGVVVYVWPLVNWPASARQTVGGPARGSVSATAAPGDSGGNLSYTGIPSAPAGGDRGSVVAVDIGPMRQWVQRMQASHSVALAGFIPRPGNNQARSKGVAWALAFTQGGPADAGDFQRTLSTAGATAARGLQMTLNVGLPALAPLNASALPSAAQLPDWTLFADNWPRVMSRILPAILMVEGSMAALAAAFTIGLSNVNVNGAASAVQAAANSLGATVAQGQAALANVTGARVAAAHAAASIPGIVQAARQTIAAATDPGAVDAAATSAQAQVNTLLANIASWTSAITTASTIAPQLSQAAAAALAQFTPTTIINLAMTPAISSLIASQPFEIAQNAVKCQVLNAVRAGVTPAYSSLIANVNAANALAAQLIASAQSTALSGFAGLSGYRPKKTGWFGRMFGLGQFSPGFSMPSISAPSSMGIPSISALQSVASQAVSDIATAATAAKAALPAIVPGASPGGASSAPCPPGQFYAPAAGRATGSCQPCPVQAITGTAPPGYHYVPIPGDPCGNQQLVHDTVAPGPSVAAPSHMPWLWIGAGVAGVAGLGWFLFKDGAKPATANRRTRHRSRRRQHA